MRVLILLLVVVLSSCSKKKEEPVAPREVDESALKGIARTNFDSPTPTQRQLERKQRSEAFVKSLGLPTLATLPVVEDDEKLKPRTTDEVVSRCLATEICAIKGEGGEQELIDKLLTDFSAKTFLSPKELAFAKDPQPTEQDRLNFSWRYECGHVFLWALGYVPELNAPNQIADVGPEVRIFKSRGAEKFRSEAKLRPASEILEQADLYYRLLWAAVELRIKGKKNPAIDEEIIEERLRALNWLIRYMNQEWDDVTTDT